MWGGGSLEVCGGGGGVTGGVCVCVSEGAGGLGMCAHSALWFIHCQCTSPPVEESWDPAPGW